MKAEDVLAAYESFCKEYHKHTIATLLATYKTTMEEGMPESEKKEKVREMVHKQVEGSLGHELKFWKAYSAGDSVGASQMAKVACEVLAI